MDPYSALQLTTPVSTKCLTVTQCVAQRDAKYLHQFFPHLLSNIFGFDSSPGWGLGQQLEKQLYDQLKAFLGPQGPLFKLITLLDNENYFYEFPITCLPVAVRCSMADGVVPQYYASKLHQLSGNDDAGFTHVSLSAFEYYFFHFAYYLIHSKTVESNEQHNIFPYHQLLPMQFPMVQLQSILYTDLLHTYNWYFLPPQRSMQPAPSPSPTKNKSPQMHKILSKKSPPTSLASTTASGGLGLLKLNGSSPAHLQQLHECVDAWCSESYLQILIEFWLNQISYESDSHSLLEQAQNQFIPSEEHCRMVRNLLKDVHFFSNGSSAISGPGSNGYLCQATDCLRKSIIPVYFQKKVYQFLRHAFKHWGMDRAFRIVLEIWLTYIQPWRYIDPSDAPVTASTTVISRTPLDPKWKDFVHDNLLFYTNLLLQFLSRSFQLDFTCDADITLVFRVAKIFSHPRLRDFIKEEESLFCSPHSFTRQTSLRSSPASALNGLKSKFVELEGASFIYQPVFTSATVEAVTLLLRKLESAKNSLHLQISSSSTVNSEKPTSFLRLLWSVFMDDDNDKPSWSQPGQGSDPTKCIEMITKTQQNLREFFQLTETVVAKPLQIHQQPQSGFSPSSGYARPEEAATPTSIRPDYTSPNQLSPLGKMQVINGLRTCNSINVQYRGDPVLQPIRSYENANLVRLLHQLSTHLNERFCSQLTRLGRSDHVICKLASQLLVPPYRGATQTQVPHTPPGAAQMESSTPFNFDSLHPRIHLRVFASYYTLVYLLLLFLLGFGLGHMTVGLLLLFGLFLYMVISYKRTKQKKH